MQLGVFPTRKLTNTWFGDPLGGELCYGLWGNFRSPSSAGPVPTDVLCPVGMTNSTREPLAFVRLAVLVPHLSIYRAGADLIANKIRAVFHGEEGATELQVDPDPPVVDAVQLSGPRDPLPGGTLSRTFARMRTLVQN